MKLRHAIPYIIMIAAAVVVLVAYQMWKLTVTDNDAPTFIVSEEILEISVSDETEAFLQGITATDDRDGDVTSSIVVEKISSINENHEVMVTYAAFDQAGNVAKQRRTVRYSDYESPRFSLNNPLLFLYGRDVNIEDNVNAFDLIDGDISHKIKPTLVSQVPLSTEGIHQMLFRITNTLGDTVELQLPVEIYPTGKYNATMTLTEYLIYLPRGGAFDAYDYLDAFRYSDNNVTLRNNIPEGVDIAIEGQVNSSVPGVYPITYTITYESGFTTFSAISKLIVVVEG